MSTTSSARVRKPRSKRAIATGTLVVTAALLAGCASSKSSTSSTTNSAGPFGVGGTLVVTTTVVGTTTTQDPAVSASTLDCGIVTFSGTAQRMQVIRGISCADAKPILAAYGDNKALPTGWQCFLGRNGDAQNVLCGLSDSDDLLNSAKVFFLRNP